MLVKCDSLWLSMLVILFQCFCFSCTLCNSILPWPTSYVFEQSYGRAIELDNTNVFAMIESGNIFSMLGSFKEVWFVLMFVHSNHVRFCLSSYLVMGIHLHSFSFLTSVFAIYIVLDKLSVQSYDHIYLFWNGTLLDARNWTTCFQKSAWFDNLPSTTYDLVSV